MSLERDQAALDQRRAIRDEIRRQGLPRPLVRDTEQYPPASPLTVTRTGEATWAVWYKASSGNTPTAADPAWTETQTGAPSISVTDGVLNVTVTSDASLYEAYSVPTFSNEKTSYLEGWLRVNSSDSGVNKGSQLSIFDGTYQFTVWLRADGLNIDGQAHVDATLSDDYHRLMFCAKGQDCQVYVDGVLLQEGHVCNASTAQVVAFGSWIANDVT